MSNQVMTKTENYHFFRMLVNKFDKDETIVALNEMIKKQGLEIGMLKSELAEAKQKKDNKPEIVNNRELKAKNKQLREDIHELKYQLSCHNIPIPKRLQ